MHERTRDVRALVVYTLVFVVGLVAFAWPFWSPAGQQNAVNDAHAGDAWIWATALGGLTVAALLIETSQRRMNGATIATLGVLASMNGLLRLIDLPGGGSAMFFFTVIAGAALGVRFGLLLGLAAIGAGAGVGGNLVATRSNRVQGACIAAFGWASQFVYGGLLNLWFWPLVRDGGSLSYESGLGWSATLGRYWSYYATTSFAWDAAGAAVNVALIVLLGAPMLRSLRRIAHRLNPSTVWL